MTQDRPFIGILLMLAFCVLAPLGDSIAKLLGETIALGILIVIRFGVQAVLLMPIVLWQRMTLRLPASLMRWTFLRTVLHIAGIGMMFSALRFLPLADALAIAFVMPFIMLLLGYFLMNEVVGPHRISACAVGFVGTLMVIQPNFVEVGYPALLPLGVALATLAVDREIGRYSGLRDPDPGTGVLAGCTERFRVRIANGNLGAAGRAWRYRHAGASLHDLEPALRTGLNTGADAVPGDTVWNGDRLVDLL